MKSSSAFQAAFLGVGGTIAAVKTATTQSKQDGTDPGMMTLAETWRRRARTWVLA
jgi:hypothetical protein